MDLVNKIEETKKEMVKLSKKLEKLETELYHKDKKTVKICQHEIVYKYVLEKTVIYTCKKCRNNLQKEEMKNNRIIVRSFI